MVRVKYEFAKLNCCLELLAVKEIISDKKKLLKNKLFDCYSEEELNKFIEYSENKFIDNNSNNKGKIIEPNI